MLCAATADASIVINIITQHAADASIVINIINEALVRLAMVVYVG